jgi:hypothetical protein
LITKRCGDGVYSTRIRSVDKSVGHCAHHRRRNHSCALMMLEVFIDKEDSSNWEKVALKMTRLGLSSAVSNFEELQLEMLKLPCVLMSLSKCFLRVAMQREGNSRAMSLNVCPRPRGNHSTSCILGGLVPQWTHQHDPATVPQRHPSR